MQVTTGVLVEQEDGDPQPSTGAPTSRSEADWLPATVQCGARHALAMAVPGREFQRDAMRVDAGLLELGPRACNTEAAGWRRASVPASPSS